MKRLLPIAIAALACRLSTSAACAQAWDDVAPPQPPAQPQPAKPLPKYAVDPDAAMFGIQSVNGAQTLGNAGAPPAQSAPASSTAPAAVPAAAAPAPVTAEEAAPWAPVSQPAPAPVSAPVAGMPAYTTQENVFSLAKPTAFFGGLTQQDIEESKTRQIIPINDPNKQSPKWAKLKPSHQFVDETEHFGNEGHMGFF